ncbi:MAG TPA: two-component regulator propeller domain-containing protein, partial [Sphingobacterium sp.]|nr:two-component regulator propeller domain-containing protein [Sphingobacterium sp.]
MKRQKIIFSYSGLQVFLAVWLQMLVVTGGNTAIGQQLHFRNYGVDHGMSSNTVWNIIQDDQGYMWFGTKNGLNRYDGRTFKVYQAHSNPSAENSFIHSICRYDSTRLWVGTEDGLYVLDLTKEQFTKINALGDDLIFSIIRDDGGHMWVGTRSNGLYRYDAEKNLFFNYRKGSGPNSISHNQVRRLQQDDDGNIWIATFGEGIDVMNPVTGVVRRIKAGNTGDHLSSNFILALYKDSSGNIWIGTLSGGLNCWVHAEDRIKIYKSGGPDALSNNIVRSIYQIDDDKLYIGTEKGLNVLDLAQDKFTFYTNNSSDPYSISDNAVYS